MGLKILYIFVLAITFFDSSLAQTYRVCAREGFSQECQAIQRGTSNVVCVNVVDNTDCALKISQGQADFGVFAAEEIVLLSLLQPATYNVLGSVRHEDRKNESFAFQSVAVVRRNYTGGLSGLRNGHFCHPGFGRNEQLWSNRVLKHFEQQVVYSSRQCVTGSRSPAESDAHALTSYFNTACRPGPWVGDSVLDAQLKLKFPTLCALCGQSNGSCAYNTAITTQTIGSSHHHQALDCLTRSGTVAYVAWQHTKEFFAARTDYTNYGVLCSDGSVRTFDNQTSITGEPPCAWIKQPWGAILAARDIGSALNTHLKTWMPNGRSKDPSVWTYNLDRVLFSEPTSVLVYELLENINVPVYVMDGRPIPSVDESKSCHSTQRWCTISAMETAKCSWIQYALLTIGAEPSISCVQSDSNVNCLKLIKENRADFTSIDSNYGYLARRTYELQNIMYHETDNLYRSKVIALLKESSTTSITRFENLRDKKACFPEYGGIAWVSFLRAAHERQVISTNECDSAVAISEFFAGACAPGATDEKHSPSKTANITRLCSVCQSAYNLTYTTSGINEFNVAVTNTENNICAANYNNHFYDTNGTLACIASQNSDVGFIESQYLTAHATAVGLNPLNFRVLCRNNTLAGYTGFQVDSACLLSETVDSEIVTRQNNDDFTALRALLHEVDDHFGYTAATTKLIGLQVFSAFNGTADLLFKDSTIGLTNSDSDSVSVKNYVDLFKHTDDCFVNTASLPGPGVGNSAAKFTLLAATISTYIVAVFIL